MMNSMIKKMVLLVVLCLTTIAFGYAQERSKAEIKISEIVKRYEEVKGVECVTVVKGRGLGLVKMSFNQQYGKEFMKGVTGITIIEYSDASPETCEALHRELDGFVELLEEFNLGKEEELSKNDYARSFASIVDEETISDFIIAIEDKESKVIMYMSGKMKLK